MWDLSRNAVKTSYRRWLATWQVFVWGSIRLSFIDSTPTVPSPSQCKILWQKHFSSCAWGNLLIFRVTRTKTLLPEIFLLFHVEQGSLVSSCGTMVISSGFRRGRIHRIPWWSLQQKWPSICTDAATVRVLWLLMVGQLDLRRWRVIFFV